jgi:hypothetical protein
MIYFFISIKIYREEIVVVTKLLIGFEILTLVTLKSRSIVYLDLTYILALINVSSEIIGSIFRVEEQVAQTNLLLDS